MQIPHWTIAFVFGVRGVSYGRVSGGNVSPANACEKIRSRRIPRISLLAGLFVSSGISAIVLRRPPCDSQPTRCARANQTCRRTRVVRRNHALPPRARLLVRSGIATTQRYCHPQADAIARAFGQFGANRLEVVPNGGSHSENAAPSVALRASA